MKWRPIVIVFAACAVVVGLGIWLQHARLMGHWLQARSGSPQRWPRRSGPAHLRSASSHTSCSTVSDRALPIVVDSKAISVSGALSWAGRLDLVVTVQEEVSQAPVERVYGQIRIVAS